MFSTTISKSRANSIPAKDKITRNSETMASRKANFKSKTIGGTSLDLLQPILKQKVSSIAKSAENGQIDIMSCFSKLEK